MTLSKVSVSGRLDFQLANGGIETWGSKFMATIQPNPTNK